MPEYVALVEDDASGVRGSSIQVGVGMALAISFHRVRGCDHDDDTPEADRCDRAMFEAHAFRWPPLS